MNEKMVEHLAREVQTHLWARHQQALSRHECGEIATLVIDAFVDNASLDDWDDLEARKHF